MESKRKFLYVGGLEPTVDEATLHAAFIPFGNIKEVNIPKDFSTSKLCTIFMVFHINNCVLRKIHTEDLALLILKMMKMLQMR